MTRLVNEADIVNKTRPLFTLSLEMTRLVNETRLLLVPEFRYIRYVCMYVCMIMYVLVCTCGNSTGSLLLPPPLFSKPVAPLPPSNTAGGSLLTTQNTLINMKESLISLNEVSTKV